jgi:hypothetical protein
MRSVAVIASVLLAAPALASGQTPDGPMTLYGVTTDPAGVTFRAPMSRCAMRADYTVAVLKRDAAPMLLISPRRSGQCPQSGAGHVDLTYSFEDLGLKPGQPFVLGNPLVGEP